MYIYSIHIYIWQLRYLSSTSSDPNSVTNVSGASIEQHISASFSIQSKLRNTQKLPIETQLFSRGLMATITWCKSVTWNYYNILQYIPYTIDYTTLRSQRREGAVCVSTLGSSLAILLIDNGHYKYTSHALTQRERERDIYMYIHLPNKMLECSARDATTALQDKPSRAVIFAKCARP